jgi:2-polyprenyl-3-methyl-5-hydroxy-6-metoxy-1,4-benzoquinol methylase
MFKKDHIQDAILFHSKNANEFADKYSHKNSFIERFAIWTKLIDEYDFNKKKIIDLGCGSGELSFYLATKDNTVIGIDGSKEMIEICCEKLESKNNKLRFIQKTIPFNSKEFTRFDGIICSSVFEYIQHVDTTLDLFNDLLLDSGTLILSVPNKLSLYRKFEKLLYRIVRRPTYYKHVYNMYSYKQVKYMLEKKGFRIEEVVYYGRVISSLDSFKLIKSSKYFNNLLVCVCTKIKSL